VRYCCPRLIEYRAPRYKKLFNRNTGSLSGYAKGVLIANAAQAVGQPSEGSFEGIEKVFAPVNLGIATHLQPARRGMLS
jgi:hypothetical protein